MCAARFAVPHPPPPPMGAPMGGQMGAQMMMQQMMPMIHQQPAVAPPIFKAHIQNKLKKVGSNIESDLIKEIKLANRVKLEGLHIVPYGINIPELAIMGKTRPDMTTRTFQLQIYGRNPEKNDVSLLLAVTVSGGVQWLPFNNSPEVDYLAFAGDFEELSIVLHGTVCESSDSYSSFPPYPSYMDDLLLPTKLSIENTPQIFNPESQPQNDAFHSKALTSFPALCEKISTIINETSLSKESVDILSYRISARHGKSLVPIKEMADLVGKIFSLQKQQLLQLNIPAMSQKCKELTDIFTILQFSFEVTSFFKNQNDIF